jgi:leucyl aminopeptidase
LTDFANLLRPDRGEPAHAIHLITKAGFDDWLRDQPERVRAAVAAGRFEGKGGTTAILPGDSAEDWSLALGVGETIDVWALAPAADRLPEGRYRVSGGSAGPATLGWLLAQHRFDRYRPKPEPLPERALLIEDVARIDETVRMAEAVALARDLIDTPAADLGPAELAAAVEAVARDASASLRITEGAALDDGYPMIAAVGRAAAPARAPRLIELEWGDPADPRIAIIGKGVCFDSGGLDIKPSSGMALMKKDMGGAATALALARLVMQAKLPVRLHLLIPAVENAISSDAMRPGDILISRKGVTVEVSNTDAEGRLILADAIARAAEGDGGQLPVLMIDFATLTGAARTALGPELPALFANDEALATALLEAAQAVSDPLWRLPLWQSYGEMLKSEIADTDNAGSGGMAGAITAALFLEKFVPAGMPWAHIDTFAWNPAAKSGRPKGGAALALRAAFDMLHRRFG